MEDILRHIINYVSNNVLTSGARPLYLSSLSIHNLKHSHLWVSLGWHANHILASPIHHQIHHSKLKRHHDKNLGSNFAICDWVFGTLYIPREREELEFGLSNDEDDEYRSVWHLLTLPFIKNYQAGRLLPTILLILVLYKDLSLS